MKSLIVSFCMFIVASASCAHASLSNEYKSIEGHRIRLENKDRSMTLEREKLENITSDISLEFGKCAGGRWSILWWPITRRLEEARMSLEYKRIEIYKMKVNMMKMRASLEKKRRGIETRYHGMKDNNYENEFRDYMNSLEIDYLLVFEEQYLPAIRAYLDAVKIWQSSLKDESNACYNNQYSAVVLEGVMHNSDKIFHAIEMISKFIK